MEEKIVREGVACHGWMQQGCNWNRDTQKELQLVEDVDRRRGNKQKEREKENSKKKEAAV